MGQGLKISHVSLVRKVGFSVKPRSFFPGWFRFLYVRTEHNPKPPSPLSWTTSIASQAPSLPPLLSLYNPFSTYPQRSLKNINQIILLPAKPSNDFLLHSEKTVNYHDPAGRTECPCYLSAWHPLSSLSSFSSLQHSGCHFLVPSSTPSL